MVVTEQYPKGLGPTVPEVAELLPPDVRVLEKTAFDAAYADELYAQYKGSALDDAADRAKLAELLAGRKILALAPGQTLDTHRQAIEAYIAENSPVIISANFVPEHYKADFAFFTNGKRFEKLEACPCAVIATSNLQGEADYRLDYNSLAGAFDKGANSLIMLLHLLAELGVDEAAIAGADGYGPAGDNYCDPRMKNHTLRGADYNHAMAEAIRAQELRVRFVTPSYYEKE